MDTRNATLEAFREYIDTIPITDTHEHLDAEEEWLKRPVELAHFFRHYASSDLVSAGMPPSQMSRFRGGGLSPEEQWSLIEPYWAGTRNSTYCRALEIAFRDLYDLPGLSKDTYQELLNRMEATRREGWYREVLKDRANVEISILAKSHPHLDRSMFAQSVNLHGFSVVSSRDDLLRLSSRLGVSITSLPDLVSALDIAFDRLVADGAIGIKIGHAYLRPIFFEDVTHFQAEAIFNRAFNARGEGASWQDCMPLQDYMVHQIIRRAQAHDLAVQIHTGIQEGNGNYIADSNPTLLINLFMMYPKVRFDIFHAGFPYSRELGVLAKNFPNVYPDLCWMHIISAVSARHIVDEWLDLVPANKILGFGGDYRFVEGIYAHVRIARDNIARVLADRVERGDQTPNEAKEIAERILRLNARELFRMDERGLPE